jgi:predicted nucleic acid-binding protein
MRSTLVDAAPLIALFDKNDAHHDRAVRFLKSRGGILLSTWPVITEVCHMLDFSIKSQISFLTWIHRGGIEIFDLRFEHIARIIELSEKYKDVPMDLADATLIVASEARDVNEIATIDSDFYVYRTIRNRFLKNVFI